MLLSSTTCARRAVEHRREAPSTNTAPPWTLSSIWPRLCSRTNLAAEQIDDVVLGCASQVDEQGANIARTAALLAGWGATPSPGATLNRFCASGVDAVGQSAARIRGDDVSLVVAGGVESVSRTPMFSDRGPLWTDPATIAQIGSIHMGIAADLNATIEGGYSRDELDAYGVETQHKAAEAWRNGAFERSVVPVPPGRNGEAGTAHDELVRAETTAEGLAALPAAFEGLGAAGQDALALAAYPEVGKIEHLHTVGSSPAMADGAALLLLGSEKAAARAGLTPSRTDHRIRLDFGESGPHAHCGPERRGGSHRASRASSTGHRRVRVRRGVLRTLPTVPPRS